MVRKISKDKYLVAAFITFGVFLLGVLLGLVIEGKRVGYVETKSREQAIDLSSLQLQYQFMDQLENKDDCPILLKTFAESVSSLENTRIRLEGYDQDAKISKYEFELLKRDYIHAQIRYWLLAKKSKEICGSDLVTVLYFFSDKEECPMCDQQAFVLTYLKKIFKEKLLIFSFDSKLENEPIISLLKHSYGVTEFPTVVVDGNVTEGFASKELLLKKICDNYDSDYEYCKK